jgi:hypothetical protein
MFDDFSQPLQPRWTQTCIGGGSLSVNDSALRMTLPAIESGAYADAQIDDYAGLARSAFPWQPPLRMEVRARSSLPAAQANSSIASRDVLCGTAGFGFWNYPFSVRGDILFLPEAVWFFYASPPSNMALVPGVPGWGWKAQVVHSMRPTALAASVPTALSMLWARISGKTQQAARWLQTVSGASEAMITADMENWHTYTLEWRQGAARFWVDDIHILTAPQPPARPLGFVAWLDNQYAIATPRGVLGFGAVPCQPEWFEIDSVRIEPC